MHEAAAAGGELARRMAQVGNFSKMDQARSWRTAAGRRPAGTRAPERPLEREQLARRWACGARKRPTSCRPPCRRCPPPPHCAPAMTPKPRPCASAWIWAPCAATWTPPAAQGWARVGTIFGDIGASYSNNTSTERATGHDDKTRAGSSTPLPLFDWGFAAAAGARSALQRSAAQLRDNATRTQRSPQQLAGLPHGLRPGPAAAGRGVPLALQEETVYRYNGMFMSVWQLLAQARSTTRRW
jgi:hypothetical protein